MTTPKPPGFETRRRKELLDELLERADTWLPDWQPQRGTSDFAHALFEIAARLESQVTQRLDRVPEKAFRGFVDWLGMRGDAGRAARVPVVFVTTPGSDPVLAPAAVQLQAADVDPPVAFETEASLQIIPGQLASMVAADPDSDRFFMPPPNFLRVEAPQPQPNEWIIRSASATGNAQLDPPEGLEVGVIVKDESGVHHEIVAFENGIATLDPPLAKVAATAADIATDAGHRPRLMRVSIFAAFEENQRERQQHALYIGSDEGLDLKTVAIIEVLSAGLLPDDLKWSYWGKAASRATGEPMQWEPIERLWLDGHLLLLKPEGVLDKMEIGGQSRRWLRATRSSGFTSSTSFGGLRLLINCSSHALIEKLRKSDNPKLKDFGNEFDTEQPECEGIANTAPLVLNAPFYPLGREPRQFESFYLGCKEALSKPGAKVILNFTVGDQFSNAVAAVQMRESNVSLVFGLGTEGKLRRNSLNNTSNVSDVQVRFLESTAPPGPNAQTISLETGVRPGVATYNALAKVVAIERRSDEDKRVWLYTQGSEVDAGDWKCFGILPDEPKDDRKPNPPTQTLLVKRRDGLSGYVVHRARLWQGDLTKAPEVADRRWGHVVNIADDNEDNKMAKIAMIAAVSRSESIGMFDEDDGLVSVSTAGRLFSMNCAREWKPVAQAAPLDTSVYPTVFKKKAGGTFVVAKLQSGEIVLIPLDSNIKVLRVDNPGGTFLGTAFGLAPPEDDAGAHHALFLVKDGDVVKLVSWNLDTGALTQELVPTADPESVQAPIAIGSTHVVPGDKGSVHVAKFTPASQTKVSGVSAVAAVIVDQPVESLDPRSIFVDVTPDRTGDTVIVPVIEAVRLSKTLAVLLFRTRAKAWKSAVAYKGNIGDPSELFQGERISEGGQGKLKLQDDDSINSNDLLYLVQRNLTTIVKITEICDGQARIATLYPSLPPKFDKPLYGRIERIPLKTSDLLPALDASDPALRARDLLRGKFSIDKALPELQTVRAIAESHWVLLNQPWEKPPSTDRVTMTFVAEAQDRAWIPFRPSMPNNPGLSWEYWDGSSWWQIPKVEDTTNNLLNTGHVSFCVPRNLGPTDVVGRIKHWIRARLVGGNYGHEVVAIETSPPTATGSGSTTQTVERSIAGIHAPYVVKLTVEYRVCCPITPQAVIAQDNGAWLDQSDANRTPGAIVEAFLPLAEALSRLAGNTIGSVKAPARVSDHGGKALYLGFDVPPVRGPISVLFLVNEGKHDAAFPLRLDVLRRNGFERVTLVDDHTRGMNESGVVSFSLTEPPTRTNLFGASLYWIRLGPNDRFTGVWQPTVRGAWLNASWATATETQSMELLGSSDGSPRQQVFLARPPVIKDTLELRIRERLEDDEVAALRFADPNAVEDELAGRMGPWARWKEVAETDAEGPQERVYMLDDESGEISFGDGLHGRIPPIGRDAILACHYRRGGGTAANRVSAWSQVNLITPIQGVSGVLIPDRSAGGSDPEQAAAVLRHASNHVFARDRILTLGDIEARAIEFSPDIAQARALLTAAGVRLVVVMGGHDPIPPQSVRRELVSYLVRRATPALSVQGAIIIVPPQPLATRVSLELVIDEVAFSGDVASMAEQRVLALFDPAIGGLDHSGWPLAALPSEADLATVLVDIPHLEQVRKISFYGVDEASGALIDLPPKLSPTQLIAIVVDGVHCEIVLSESELGR